MNLIRCQRIPKRPDADCAAEKVLNWNSSSKWHSILILNNDDYMLKLLISASNFSDVFRRPLKSTFRTLGRHKKIAHYSVTNNMCV